MPCPEGCECVACCRSFAFAHWGLSDYQLRDGHWLSSAHAHYDGDYMLPTGEVVPGFPEFGRKTLSPRLGDE